MTLLAFPLGRAILIKFEEDSDHDAVAHGDRRTHGVLMWNEDLVYLVVTEIVVSVVCGGAGGTPVAWDMVWLALARDSNLPTNLTAELDLESQHLGPWQEVYALNICFFQRCGQLIGCDDLHKLDVVLVLVDLATHLACRNTGVGQLACHEAASF